MTPPLQHLITLGEWMERWIRFYAPVRCKSGVTLERYGRLANYLLEGATWELGNLSGIPLAHLTHQKIEDALLTLLISPAKRKKHLSATTVHHLGGLLGSALAKAARMELLPRNPMPDVQLPPRDQAETRSLTAAEVKRLRNVCRGEWTHLFVELGLATGLRRGELLALTWADIHHTTRVLSVNKSLEETKRGLRLKHTKSGKSRRCTLPQTVMIQLPQYDRKGKLRDGLLFPDEGGRWRKPALVSQLISRRMRQCGIENASLHSLRHTHASLLLSRGMPLPAVSARLGHSDPGVTLRIYAHALPPDDERLACEWDRILSAL